MDDSPFPKNTGIRYLRFLAMAHHGLAPDWYLEIGTNKGHSLATANCNCIAVDPEFLIDSNVVGSKRSLHMFQMTSDDFFAEKHANKLGHKIDFAFLDGLHLFEFLLRDFIGTEKLSGKDSAIAMHDCIPMTHIAAERNWDKTKTKAWTGDVWKLVPILKKYRPDLTIEVIDCPPSGLTFVTNLNPQSTVLESNYEKIIDEYMEVSLAEYGEERLIKELDIQSSRSWPVSRFIGGEEPGMATSN